MEIAVAEKVDNRLRAAFFTMPVDESAADSSGRRRLAVPSEPSNLLAQQPHPLEQMSLKVTSRSPK